jgi:putative endonuclease
MTRQRIALGKRGEDLACDELLRRHYTIVERRYRTRAGEIDIVARDGPTLVFVEVKSRAGSEFGGGLDAVTWHKRRQIVAMARDYVARRKLGDVASRFDVVSVDLTAVPPAIVVIPGAFGVGE